MMADPMANLTDDPSSGGGDPNSTTGATGGHRTREVVDGMLLMNNLMRIDRIRSIMGIVSGCFVGIGGITGLQGFGTYQFYFSSYKIARNDTFSEWKSA